MLTKDMIQKALPANMKANVSDGLVDLVNNITNDPIVAQSIRDNFISYTGVMKEGRFNTKDYLYAVAFVSYKLMGDTNKEAYFKTFPDRYQDMLARGVSDKDMSSYVASYARGKLVNLILEQSLVPSWVLNQDLYQKALNTQADLMLTAKSEKVRSDAANSLLTHLKQPETQKVQLDIGVKETSVVQDMRNAVQALAAAQRDQIRAGQATAQGVAHSKLVAEVVDVEVKEV